jgi:hypothetical protein
MSGGGTFSQPFRQGWLDEQQHLLDLLLRRYEVETDPKAKLKLRRQIASRRRLLSMGPERTHEAKLKQDQTLGRG